LCPLNINPLLIKEIVERALQEDLYSGDITTESIFGKTQGDNGVTDTRKIPEVQEERWAEGIIAAREKGIMAGLPVVEEVFARVDARVVLHKKLSEGEVFHEGDALARIEGPIAGILSGERVALNFLQRLCGIATETRQAVEIIKGSTARITDTRKTTPGLRRLEKYAVRVGGGENHRLNLSDMVLIKDNHIRGAGSIGEAVSRAREHTGFPVKIEVETTDLEEVREALAYGADIIMLDNMSLSMMSEAVNLIKKRALVEASGGITGENLASVAATGVDLISLGYLTHGTRALDISLDLH